MTVVAQSPVWNSDYAWSNNCTTKLNQLQIFTLSTTLAQGKACYAAHLTKHLGIWKSLMINCKMIKPSGVIDSSSCVKIHPHTTFEGNTVPKGKLQTLEIDIEEERKTHGLAAELATAILPRMAAMLSGTCNRKNQDNYTHDKVG